MHLLCCAQCSTTPAGCHAGARTQYYYYNFKYNYNYNSTQILPALLIPIPPLYHHHYNYYRYYHHYNYYHYYLYYCATLTCLLGLDGAPIHRGEPCARQSAPVIIHLSRASSVASRRR